MIDLIHSGDVTSEIPDATATAPLRASINAFAASLAAAHPCIFMRSPVCEVEHIAALLHMSLDYCRDLLAVYDSLLYADAGWVFEPFEPRRGERDDEGDDEHETGDDDDIPF